METGYCVFPEEEFFPEHELLAVERVNEVKPEFYRSYDALANAPRDNAG